ncbi:Glycosyl hydrolases family 43 [Paenibacillus konkukensis]|uniref:Glycosyl hydrolases family 43 n=1 Tax=Paenibacillus konkukensis TaxID=2020716 RepID=A0ABY4RVB4_9BACL|nr:glycoside hydrolase family 43 protein [Paenibacillus konkukensis]UQZ85289.1 Glycosyl hydrolases family 43 [Paenibacillus konkukensis]
MKRLNDIHLRDPFILPVESIRKYYLYGTSGETAWTGKPHGFDVYISDDLQQWDGPYPAFVPEPSFWADQHYWAPEVHEWKGQYYMLASFKSENRCRGTEILVSSRPEGPFAVHGDGPVTPRDWECLDGTLYVDRAGDPWIVFCHEWVQIKDGEICAMRLTPDLKEAAGEPITLFKASDAPWVRPVRGDDVFVTDGPFFYTSRTGELLLLWSSFGDEGYAMGIARSLNGDIEGPWVQEQEPFFRKDGGHGMLFHGFAGGLMLPIHTPNKQPLERPHIFRVEDRGGTLAIESALF